MTRAVSSANSPTEYDTTLARLGQCEENGNLWRAVRVVNTLLKDPALEHSHRIELKTRKIIYLIMTSRCDRAHIIMSRFNDSLEERIAIFVYHAFMAWYGNPSDRANQIAEAQRKFPHIDERAVQTLERPFLRGLYNLACLASMKYEPTFNAYYQDAKIGLENESPFWSWNLDVLHALMICHYGSDNDWTNPFENLAVEAGTPLLTQFWFNFHKGCGLQELSNRFSYVDDTKSIETSIFRALSLAGDLTASYPITLTDQITYLGSLVAYEPAIREDEA